MAAKVPNTHKAVVAVGKRAPLELLEVPTIRPDAGEVLIKVFYVSCTPLNLHRADGGLLAKYPQGMDGGFVGEIVLLGTNTTTNLAVGDRVFGFTWRSLKEAPWQEYITTSEFMLGKIPEHVKDEDLAEYATVPDSFVTAWHTITTELSIDLPWPKPQGWSSSVANTPILVWGGSSSVGWFTLQILKWAGFSNVTATASAKQHELLKTLGATYTLDYRDANIIEELRAAANPPSFKYIIDCIGSYSGSVTALTKVAATGSKIAIMLPVIDEAHGKETKYFMGVTGEDLGISWNHGVVSQGVRTHFYLDNKFNAEHLQSIIMPALIESGAVRPMSVRVVPGNSSLERAENALDLLRGKTLSGERLVWSLQ